VIGVVLKAGLCIPAVLLGFVLCISVNCDQIVLLATFVAAVDRATN